MMIDYHVHSRFSTDSQEEPLAQVRQAERLGLTEICFTEHMDFDENRVPEEPFDMEGYLANMEQLQAQSSIEVRMGAELGLRDAAGHAEAMAFLKPYPVDFIIGSVHCTDEGDAYEPAFYKGRGKQEAYCAYLEGALARLKCGAGYQIMGHIDYPAKKAPYEDRALTYAMAAEQLDAIFRYLIEHGIGLEINTSVYSTREEKMWGADYLRRYAELGGEFVTIGSDAHIAARLGWRGGDALELAREAGIRYLATFRNKKPDFHRI